MILTLTLPTSLHGPLSSLCQVSKAALDALHLLLDATPPLKAFDFLAPHLPSVTPSNPSASGDPHQQQAASAADVLCVVLRSLHDVMRGASTADLIGEGFNTGSGDSDPRAGGAAVLPRLVPGLIRAFNHSRADVRKATVFCLVEAWVKVGDGVMEPHLSGLNEAQRKLVTIYHDRALTAA